MYYGRGRELKRLYEQIHDASLPPRRRLAADRTRAKIMDQLRDRRLMGLRERLIKATQAGDQLEQHRITAQMRDYLGEDRETGAYM